jgi:hypothetical protein
MAAKAAAAAKSRSTTGAKKAGTPKQRATPVKKSTAKKPVAKKAVRKRAPARTVKGNVVTPVAWGPAQRTDELAKTLGGVTALARALGVSPSQPSRWRSGKEAPSPEVERRLIDLDHVVARAKLVWHPDVVPVWLRSPNQHLYGQTPLGVLMTRGPAEVLLALDATDQGAFA